MPLPIGTAVYARLPLPTKPDELPAFLGRELGKVERAIKDAAVRPYRALSADTTLTLDDEIVDVDATAGAVTITLPDVRKSAGRVLSIKKVNIAFTVTIASAALIDGAATLVLSAQWQAYTVYSSGTTWRIHRAYNPTAISSIPDGDYTDITVYATGTAMAIDNDAVTYAKMQNVAAASRVLGRGSAAGAGDVEELTLGAGISLAGTVLSAGGSGGTVTSVSGTGAVNGLTLTGTVTTTGSLTLGGTLTVPASVVTPGTFGAGAYVFPAALAVTTTLGVTGVATLTGGLSMPVFPSTVIAQLADDTRIGNASVPVLYLSGFDRSEIRMGATNGTSGREQFGLAVNTSGFVMRAYNDALSLSDDFLFISQTTYNAVHEVTLAGSSGSTLILASQNTATPPRAPLNLVPRNNAPTTLNNGDFFTTTTDAFVRLGGVSLSLTTIAASALTGTTLASNVVTSSLTTIGTLIAGAVPVSLLTGILPVTQGGSGLNASAVLDGQLLIGNDAANGFTLATLTGGSNTLISNSAGAITISSTVSGGGANGRIYYPMNSVASDLAGYKVAATTPSSGATSNVSIVCPTQNAYVLGEEFATLAGEPNTTSLPAGTAIRFFFASVSGGTGQIQVNLFQYKATGDVATTGGVALTYVNGGAAADTITRAAGSFITDGFTAGCKVTVAGSALNNGTYTAQTVAAGTLTLILSDVLTAEVVSSTITTKEKLLRTGVSPEFMNTSAQLIQFFYTDSAAHTLAADDRILFKWFGRRTNAGASQTITIGTEGLATASYIQTTLPVNLGLAQGTTMQLSALTASELVGTDATKTLVSLPIVTYPSLAELAYVKGLTSAAQTQITARVVSGGALGTPSSGVATNLTGTAAGLTAGNASIAPAGTLTGATLSATVLASSLTSVGTLASGAVPASLVTAGTFGAGNYTFPAGVTVTNGLNLANSNIPPTAGIYYGINYVQIVGGTDGFSVNNAANSVALLLILNGGAATFASSLSITGAFTGATTGVFSGAVTFPGSGIWNASGNVGINITPTERLHVSGNAIITGTLSGISTLTATTLAGTLSTAAQPNITSVGTLTALAVSGNVSQNAVAQAAASVVRVVKNISSIANAVATTVATITIPNGAHSASVLVHGIAWIGAGGAIGAHEGAQAFTRIIVITRTAGLNTASNSDDVTAGDRAPITVVGGTGINVNFAPGTVAGASGATQTVPITVTLGAASGASTNHRCICTLELINAEDSGISIA